MHSQPIWYLWFRLFFWVVLRVSQGTMKSQRVICISPFPSAFPEETGVTKLRMKLRLLFFFLHLDETQA